MWSARYQAWPAIPIQSPSQCVPPAQNGEEHVRSIAACCAAHSAMELRPTTKDARFSSGCMQRSSPHTKYVVTTAGDLLSRILDLYGLQSSISGRPVLKRRHKDASK